MPCIGGSPALPTPSCLAAEKRRSFVSPNDTKASLQRKHMEQYIEQRFPLSAYLSNAFFVIVAKVIVPFASPLFSADVFHTGLLQSQRRMIALSKPSSPPAGRTCQPETRASVPTQPSFMNSRLISDAAYRPPHNHTPLPLSPLPLPPLTTTTTRKERLQTEQPTRRCSQRMKRSTDEPVGFVVGNKRATSTNESERRSKAIGRESARDRVQDPNKVRME